MFFGEELVTSTSMAVRAYREEPKTTQQDTAAAAESLFLFFFRWLGGSLARGTPPFLRSLSLVRAILNLFLRYGNL